MREVNPRNIREVSLDGLGIKISPFEGSRILRDCEKDGHYDIRYNKKGGVFGAARIFSGLRNRLVLAINNQTGKYSGRFDVIRFDRGGDGSGSDVTYHYKDGWFLYGCSIPLSDGVKIFYAPKSDSYFEMHWNKDGNVPLSRGEVLDMINRYGSADLLEEFIRFLL